jgi:hypothetical protein
MRFEDERYVRAYTRDTTNWIMLPWEGRTVALHLWRKLDRAGVLDLGEHDAYKAVAAQCRLPIEVVNVGLAALIENGTLVYLEDRQILCAPNFIEAQEAKQSDKARQIASRERARAVARLKQLGDLSQNVTRSMSQDVTLGAEAPEDEMSQNVTRSMSQNVTPADPAFGRANLAAAVTPRDTPSRGDPKRHTRSHAVTSCHSVPSLAVPSRTPDPTSNLDPVSSTHPSRARTREAEMSAAESAVGPSLDRTHPDEAMVDRSTPVQARLFVPDQFVLAKALADGMTNPEVTSVLADYRAGARPPVRSQYQHDKAFEGWLRHALENKRAAKERGGQRENTQRGNGAGNGHAGGDRAAGAVTLGGMDRTGPLHRASTQRRYRKPPPDGGAAK